MNSFAWLAWAFAVMAVVLVVRNPWVIAEAVIVVLCVRIAWTQDSGGSSAGWLLRLSVGFALVSVVFNGLTVHSGNQVLITIPNDVPGLGGPITLNAVAYGVVSSVAMVALVVAGLTASEHLVWADVFRVLPTAFEPVAVSTSVAWSFLPQVRMSWQNIREAQAMRGFELRGVKSHSRVIVPLMGTALDRSLVMAEALEARGYGGPASNGSQGTSGLVLLVAGVALFLAASIAALSAAWVLAVACAVLGVVALALAVGRIGATAGPRTRYRSIPWSRVDRIMITVSVVVVLVMIGTLVVAPETGTFPAYPDLNVPIAPLALMASMVALLLPAWAATESSPR